VTLLSSYLERESIARYRDYSPQINQTTIATQIRDAFICLSRVLSYSFLHPSISYSGLQVKGSVSTCTLNKDGRALLVVYERLLNNEVSVAKLSSPCLPPPTCKRGCFATRSEPLTRPT
jgi:hypothetical protein